MTDVPDRNLNANTSGWVAEIGVLVGLAAFCGLLIYGLWWVTA